MQGSVQKTNGPFGFDFRSLYHHRPGHHSRGRERARTMQIHSRSSGRKRAYSLHHGRLRRPIVRILPDSAALYRIEWPDIGLSAPANLARCMEAALAWGEQRLLTEHRKMNGARRLKSLDNFSWSASPVAPMPTGSPRRAAANRGAS